MKLNINIIFLLSISMVAFSCNATAVILTEDELDEYRKDVRNIETQIQKNVSIIEVPSTLPLTSEDRNLTIMLGNIYDDLASYYSHRVNELEEEGLEKLLDLYIKLKEQNSYTVIP